MQVKVVTIDDYIEFDTLEEATSHLEKVDLYIGRHAKTANEKFWDVPLFDGFTLCLDGDKLRYESWEVYEMLSC